jgi:type VI secretion system secreted protein Hcp
MAYDVFMYFTGKGKLGTEVIGETSDNDMSGKKAFEIDSYSFGARNPATIGSQSGGAGAGKVAMTTFDVMKRADQASTSLFKACCVGDHFPEATIILRKSGSGKGNENTFVIYTFKKVFVENIHWSGSARGDEVPTESVSFAFGSVKVEYKKQDREGKLAPAGEMMYSVVKNAETQEV